MARVTHVKRAQQRYKTVTVMEDDGVTPKKVPVYTNRVDPETGEKIQKTSKRGPVFRTVTIEDKNQPLPNRKCEKCGKEIKVGDPYKWVAPKSGPYGGHKRFRCGDCPSWTQGELSSSKMAEIYLAQEQFDVSGCESKDDIDEALNDFAETVRDVATQYGESADNIEDGFGHETYQSSELRERQEMLEAWADEIEQGVEGEDEFDRCENHEEFEPDATEVEECEECQDRRNDWLEELRSNAEDAINNIPM